MEIKIKFNKDLDVQGLNVQLVRETSLTNNNKSFTEYQQKIQKCIEKSDAHWQRQIETMEHTMHVLNRRMDAFKKRNPDF